MAAEKRQLHRVSRGRKRQWMGFAGTAALILAFTALSAFWGDALWDYLLPPAPVEALAQAEPVAMPTQAPVPLTEGSMPQDINPEQFFVWVPASGSRYHLIATCSGMQSAREVPISQANQEGFTPCQRCKPPEYSLLAEENEV